MDGSNFGGNMKTLGDLKKLFMESDKEIGYDWDCDHAYSYLKNVPDYSHLSESEQAEFEDFTGEWLYENDECPPCQIHIDDDMVVSSRCGCHDGKDYIKDREDIENTIRWLAACL
jgi:hypothetical protein